MNFNTLVNNLINGNDNGALQTYINNSGITHTQNEYDCLAYLQGTFKTTMTAFLNPSGS
jgi:hypothetical protein